VIHATFPLARAADAHRVMESGVHIGKLVLVV
jgi:NADPH2:quinone reductase